MTRRIDVAVFTSEAALLGAVRTCREQEFEIVDVRSPHPVHGLDEAAGIRRTRLPVVTLVAGIAGFSLGTWLQFWTSSTDWPIDVGGKPWDSMAAFLPVTFELTVLAAGLATVAALFIRCRLRPAGRATLTELGTTDDRYALLVASPMGHRTAEEIRALFQALGAESGHVVSEGSL